MRWAFLLQKIKHQRGVPKTYSPFCCNKTMKQKTKKSLKQRLQDGWKWTKANLLTKDTLLFTLIGESIFWSPVIVCCILGWLVNTKYLAVAGSIVAFWTAPFTPGWALQVGLILGLKKLFSKNKGKKKAPKEKE